MLLNMPRGLQRRLAGPPPNAAPELDPGALLLARLADRFGTELVGADKAVTAERVAFDARARALGGRVSSAVRTEDLTVAGAEGALPARLYVPAGAPEPSPLIVFFHGGGWVHGSIESHDSPCRLLADLGAMRVLSVGYRLAPEHPFPAPAHDALAAWIDAVANADALGADPTRIGLGGDSAGGNLAAVTALQARDGAHQLPAFQLLIYPVCDLSRKRDSMRTFASGFLLSESDMDRYKDLYAPDPERWADPLASPLLAADLRGLPPAHIATAAADPLRDEGEDYAAALAAAGVPVTVERHPQLHGFLNMTSAPAARRAIAAIARAAASACAPSATRPDNGPAPAH